MSWSTTPSEVNPRGVDLETCAWAVWPLVLRAGDLLLVRRFSSCRYGPVPRLDAIFANINGARLSQV